MTDTRQTLLLLRGTTGAGKTAVREAMERGDRHLLAVPILQDAMTRGFAQFTDEVKRDIWAGRTGPWDELEEAIGDKPYFLSDLYGGEDGDDMARLPELGERYRKVRLVVAPLPWLVQARRDLRLRDLPKDSARKATPDATTQPDLLDYYDLHDLEFQVLDTSDYPIVALEAPAARRLLAPGEPLPLIMPEPATMYQQSLHIAGEWYGATGQRREWEWSRLQAILPERLDGWSVLDVGASEGGMCYEALHRGALYATAVEIREPQIETMRTIRNAARLNMTVANVDVFAHPPPAQYCHENVRRYDLGLVLNILHYPDDPWAVLRRILDVCDRMVIETPSGPGDAPYKPGLAPYPNAWHLPWNWVKAQGEAAGFNLTSITVGPYYPGQRLIFKLERANLEAAP